MQNILLTGGGTAGHVYPLIAVAKELEKNKELNLLYVGSINGQEKEAAMGASIAFVGLAVGKWRPYFSFNNFWDLFKALFGLIQAFFVIISFKPNVVFAKGGFVTIPVLFWARIFKIPVVVHESDVVMGKANLWAGKFAKKICVSFPEKYYDSEPAKLIYTGLPTREDFFITQNQSDGKTILVTGGSQGAHRINELIKEILPLLLEKYTVYHLSGETDFFKLKNFSNPNYHLEKFNANMAEIMSKADLIISRVGATTFAEIAAMGKPSILIPYPHAAADHQAKNAKIFAEADAAEVVLEKDLTSQKLLGIINRTMQDDNLRMKLGQSAARFASPDAAKKIANIILMEVNKNGNKK